MKPKIKRLPLVWKIQASLTAIIQHGDRRLVVLAADGVTGWSVLAVEGAAADTEAGFLDNHGHALVGTYRSLALATRAMERYAEKWFKEKIRVERCACKALARPGKGKQKK